MIRKLKKEVVDRIAAGEVIERPASVVKELVENALDAGARRVEVALEAGGRQLIRVSDDGSGIAGDELLLAFEPHATSKLSEVDDLLAIASYGFRGEALASIGAVSRARIRSRVEGADGFEVVCEGGEIGAVKPCGTPRGTLIEARNLFFNIPARARFLKGDAAEASRCLDQVLRFALLDEGVAFRVTHNDKAVFEVAADASRVERFANAYGADLARDLIAIDHHQGGIFVQGLIGPPSIAKSVVRQQLMFMNGRIIQDGTIKTAVRQAFREFLAPTLQPVFAVFLTIDPAEVDVNVHPAKSEVRFRDSNEVFRAVHHAVLDALRAADLAPRPGPPQPRTGSSAAPSRAPAPAPPRSPGRPTSAESRPLWSTPMGVDPLPVMDDLPAARDPLPHVVREVGGSAAEPAIARPEAGPPPARDRSAPPLTGPAENQTPARFVPAVPPRTGRGYLRLFSTYILYEADGDLCLVDQHALHERVLYERLRTQLLSGKVSSQRLLVPAVIEVGRSEVMRAEEHRDAFAAVGLEVTAFSTTSLAVHALPTLLKRGRPDDLVAAVLGAVAGADRQARATLEEPLHSMACRGAVKAGDPLDDREVDALLDEAARLPEAKACPHGRPTCVRMSRNALENWFKRTGF